MISEDMSFCMLPDQSLSSWSLVWTIHSISGMPLSYGVFLTDLVSLRTLLPCVLQNVYFAKGRQFKEVSKL